MITSLSAKGFTAIPYLESSPLMRARPTVVFSTTKPNLIVGENGAGKTALIDAIRLQHLCFTSSSSRLETKYLDETMRSANGTTGALWGPKTNWGARSTAWLPGLDCETDFAPARYYRHGAIPGEERCVTTSMMCGYFEEARAYGKLVDGKSRGQQGQSVLNLLLQDPVLGTQVDYACGWSYGREVDTAVQDWSSGVDRRINALKRIALAGAAAPTQRVVLLDEPEQSLSTGAEIALWRTLAAADMSMVQVIVATHSAIPLHLYPSMFNVIEASPGYADFMCSVFRG